MSGQHPDPCLLAARFYQTPEHPCSYLPEQQASTLFLDPQLPVTLALYQQLTLLGFRRSGQHIYRPHCLTCQACHSVRVPVATFQPNRQQRRVWKRNQDLQVVVQPLLFRQEHYQLYVSYISTQHADGDMYPPSESQYRQFLLMHHAPGYLVEFRDRHQLLAVAAVDQLYNSLSAIYTFYTPDQPKRSLGVFAVLWQIERARKLKLDHVYLGYWISNCRKMRYKSQYQPLELLKNQHWVDFQTLEDV